MKFCFLGFLLIFADSRSPWTKSAWTRFPNRQKSYLAFPKGSLSVWKGRARSCQNAAELRGVWAFPHLPLLWRFAPGRSVLERVGRGVEEVAGEDVGDTRQGPHQGRYRRLKGDLEVVRSRKDKSWRPEDHAWWWRRLASDRRDCCKSIKYT